MNKHAIEYTDTFAGESNYSWVRRAVVDMPELTAFGYDGGGNYSQADKRYRRELMRRAKAALGLSGLRGVAYWHGDTCEFRPYRITTVLFITWAGN